MFFLFLILMEKKHTQKNNTHTEPEVICALITGYIQNCYVHTQWNGKWWTTKRSDFYLKKGAWHKCFIEKRMKQRYM